MKVKIYIPRDSNALSKGADSIAQHLQKQARQRDQDVQIVRNGSRGLFWLEPLIEVETEAGRVGYGPVTLNNLPDLIEQGLLEGSDQHPLYLGDLEQLPYLAKQTRLTFARAGVIDPVSVVDYQKYHGYAALKHALSLSQQQAIEAVTQSGLRGRGGAGFPAGIKWQTVSSAKARQKYVVCNADEGDSGTFADRLLMEADPLMLVEGMTISALTVGASKGFIYLRSEYPNTAKILQQALDAARLHGFLGRNILDSGQDFDIEIRVAAGSYVCGEETAMLESIEGKRGQVRSKPPIPALEGLFGQPTLVNNVLTFAAIPSIFSLSANSSAEQYYDYGCNRSRGTMPFQLAGNVKQGGLIELPFGVSLKSLLEDFSGHTESGAPVKAVQVGGPLGAYLSANELDIPLDYEAFSAKEAVLGHGGIVVFDTQVDMLEQAQFAMEFCVEESCGKCTPCRIGSVRGVEILDQIKHVKAHANGALAQQVALLDSLCETMEQASLCAMGSMTPIPVKSAMRCFPEDFGLPKP